LSGKLVLGEYLGSELHARGVVIIVFSLILEKNLPIVPVGHVLLGQILYLEALHRGMVAFLMRFFLLFVIVFFERGRSDEAFVPFVGKTGVDWSLVVDHCHRFHVINFRSDLLLLNEPIYC